ncbi:MAG TPA: metalloregulator ArsR/SmtB family transcription factor [Solirubrobacteraceae bacterium]|nr:metalloregulator ArsR/SmtB family transcription factor [Solirubrobacteraceae bacterium]
MRSDSALHDVAATGASGGGEEAEEAFSGSLADVDLDALELATVLQALADPIRLRIVAALADDCEWTCGSLELPIAKSTKSHHLRVLGEAGIVSRRVEGKCRMIKLRRAEMEERFPGLLESVLAAAALPAETPSSV